ncbi:tyrosine-type recombinase/integrase [Burkholderia sp. Ax-1719]|nr:tyrosine-type recombinase/integrase [Burkholderia sp. Ax-1719]
MPIRPLGEVAAPAHLLGSDGTNRAPIELLEIDVHSDIEAAHAFFAQYEHSPGTLRLYLRAVEGLFLWTWAECGKPLSSLDRRDFESFVEFLASPQPEHIWCGPKSRRNTSDWRPFEGAMQDVTMRATIAALNSFMQFLVAKGYLQTNPVEAVKWKRRRQQADLSKAGRTPESETPVTRVLDADMWKAIVTSVESMPRATEREIDSYERLRFLCAFLYLLAPSAGELESHRMSSFQEERGRWWWHVSGRDGKTSRVPLPQDMLAALTRYRRHLGLPDAPDAAEATPLLVSVRNGASISARQLHNILKNSFNAAADILPDSLSHKAARLRQASTHWGRHTSVAAKLEAGVSARTAQQDARHAKKESTARYVHDDDTRRYEEAQKHRLPWQV